MRCRLSSECIRNNTSRRRVDTRRWISSATYYPSEDTQPNLPSGVDMVDMLRCLAHAGCEKRTQLGGDDVDGTMEGNRGMEEGENWEVEGK